MHKALFDFKSLSHLLLELSFVEVLRKVWLGNYFPSTPRHTHKSTHWETHNQSKLKDRWWFLKVAQACTIYFLFFERLPASWMLIPLSHSPAQLWKVFKTLILSRGKEVFLLCDFLLDVFLVQTSWKDQRKIRIGVAVKCAGDGIQMLLFLKSK